ncbi:hypothetical protein [Streptomyces malaysiensis]|uniref:hypothetical protein n=1 Tax=Streptomyces malaysiensis TaxID=92644 RepID=UPI0031B61D24
MWCAGTWRASAPSPGARGGRAAGACRPQAGRDGRLPDREASLARPRAALAALFEPDRDSLRLTPERLADAFQLTLMSAGRLGAPAPLTTEELVDLFLHGALAAPGDAR